MATQGPLRILPPLGYGGVLMTLGRCQAAISVSCHAPHHCMQPLPRWRYCSFSGDNVNGLMLCGVHYKAADRRGTERLLPELRFWKPPVLRGQWDKQRMDGCK